MIRAMELALRSSGINKKNIDFVSAHGTSTKLNDAIETAAIKNLFGKRAYDVPVSSIKSQIGHTTNASGAVKTIACLMMLQKQILAPTINLVETDPECDLDYVPNCSRVHKVDYILSNNFGFGGQNACLVIGRV